MAVWRIWAAPRKGLPGLNISLECDGSVQKVIVRCGEKERILQDAKTVFVLRSGGPSE